MSFSIIICTCALKLPTLIKIILWWSKYYGKTKVISTLNNLVQARIKKRVNSISVLNSSLEIKVWTHKYILLGIVYVYKDFWSKFQSYDRPTGVPMMLWDMNN